MKSLSKLTVLVALASVVGVGAAHAAAAHTVAWYVANRDALKVKLEECQADPGDLASAPDCINARDAEADVVLRDF